MIKKIIIQITKYKMRKCLEEYTFYLIAEFLEIGPKLTRCFGFDIIVYQDCIQFSIEKCRNPKL